MAYFIGSFIKEIIFFAQIHGSNIQGRQRERAIYFIVLFDPNVSTSDSACKRKKSHVTMYEVCQALKKKSGLLGVNIHLQLLWLVESSCLWTDIGWSG